MPVMRVRVVAAVAAEEVVAVREAYSSTMEGVMAAEAVAQAVEEERPGKEVEAEGDRLQSICSA